MRTFGTNRMYCTEHKKSRVQYVRKLDSRHEGHFSFEKETEKTCYINLYLQHYKQLIFGFRILYYYRE
jgi:hypothetical protein